MAEKLKRWSPLLAAVILIWVGWSGLRAPPEKKVERASMPEVALSDIPRRDAGEPVRTLADPCKLEARVETASTSSAGIRAASGAVHEDSVHGDTGHAEAEPKLSRVLSLDAILVAPEGAQAFISGQTITVGATIGGVDPESPPVLSWIDGVSAGVSYRGREYVLDLDRDRRVTLGLRTMPGAAAATPAVLPPEVGP